MADYTRDQLMQALRDADRAGDTPAATAIARRIRSMDGTGLADAIKASAGTVAQNATRNGSASIGMTDMGPPPRKTGFSRGRDLTNRAVVEGAGGVAAFSDMINPAGQIATRVGLPGPGELLNRGANYVINKAGLTKPETSGEQLYSAGVRGATQAVPFLAAGGAPILPQLVGGASGGVSSEGARQMGASPWQQTAAGVVGGLAGYGATSGLTRLAGPRIPAPDMPPPSLGTTGSASSRRAALDAYERGQSRDAMLASSEREGVPVMTTDLFPPKTRIGRGARTVGELIPFAGTGGKRAAQQTERVAAVKNLVDEYGTGGNYGAAIDAVADDVAKTRSGMLTNFTAQKQTVINRLNQTGAVVPVNNTIAALDNQIAKLTARNTEPATEAAKKLQDLRTRIEGRTIQQAEDFRRDELATAFKDDNLPFAVRDVGQKAMRALYDPFRKDMGEFIKSVGGGREFQQWRRANDRLSGMAGEMESRAFKSMLNSAETEPENVARLLMSRKPSDLRRLTANMSERGKANARAAYLYKALEDAGEETSPQLFAKSLGRMEVGTSAVFSPADKVRLDGFSRLIKGTQQASVASAHPATGAQNTPLLLGYGIGALASKFALPVTAVMGGLARAYESQAMRNALLKLGRTRPGTVAEARAASEASGVLMVSLRSMVESRPPVNDNLIRPLAPRLAADPEEERQRR